MVDVMLSDMLTVILIPLAAIIGIGFSLFQWYLVSKVSLTSSAMGNGLSDRLIEDEECLSDHGVVARCAEIQNAISEGINT